MELSKQDSSNLKGIAILLMVLLHLFATKNINGQFVPLIFVNDVPLVYYIALLGDACRPIYLFVTGYALFLSINKNKNMLFYKNINRVMKLLVNYWVVILIFVPIGIFWGREDVFSMDLIKFLLNFFAISNSYNGAWWFVQIYIIIVLISPVLVRIVVNINSYLLISISGIIYLFAHLQRYRELIDFGENSIILWIVNLFCLMGTSLFSFFIGSIFAKKRLFTRIHNKLANIKHKNWLCLIILLLVFGFHSIVESSIIAPINGITIIILYSILNKNEIFVKVLSFLSKHSTNIWLTHMFFYMSIFPVIVYFVKYPVLIYLWLLLLCIGTSYVIKIFTKPINYLTDKKLLLIKRNLELPKKVTT